MIMILKLHSDGEDAEEILNLGERRIRRNEDEKEEKRKEPPNALFPFYGLSEKKFPVKSLLLDGFFDWAQRDLSWTAH